MKNLFLVLVATFALTLAVNAQVGIGSVPKSKSILDLTNTDNKYLILPVTYGDPDTILQESASVIYHDDNIYLKTSDGIKVFTPWKWDGDSTHAISSPISAPVGIGVTPVLNAPFCLQVANSVADVTETTSDASIIVGNPDSVHISIDNDEIMAKINPNTSGNLKLQEEGGIVTIRSNASDAGVNTVLTAYGSVDAKGKIKENGNDLVPVGSIFMWSGAIVPAGWALCDGGSYPKQDGTGNITTPILIDRFIVGADIGGNGVNGTYAKDSIGGALSSSHTHTVDPASFTANLDGSDSHVISGASGSATQSSNCSGCANYPINSAQNHTHTIYNSTHNHTIDLPLKISTNASNTENRPPFYALAFIMKL